MSIFFEKHAPKTFDELVFPSAEMAERFGHYKDGNKFEHILMYPLRMQRPIPRCFRIYRRIELVR